jgi:hypothetical protein
VALEPGGLLGTGGHAARQHDLERALSEAISGGVGCSKSASSLSAGSSP